MEMRRFMWSVEAVLLLAIVATATPELGDSAGVQTSEVVLLDETPSTKAQLLRVDAEDKKSALQEAIQAQNEGKKLLAANEVDLKKLQATVVSAEESFAKAKNPKENRKLRPADPAVIESKGEELASLKSKTISMEQAVEAARAKVQESGNRVAQAEKDAENAERQANEQAAADEKAKLAAEAKAAAEKAAAEKRAKEQAEAAAKAAHEQRLETAKGNLRTARSNKAMVETQDTKLANDAELHKSQMATTVADDKVKARESAVAAKASSFHTSLKEQEAETAREVLKEALAAKAAAEKVGLSAEEQYSRGKQMMESANEMLKLNEDRIITSEAAMHRAHKHLQEMVHEEKMDHKGIEHAQKTIAAMHAEITALEKKKELVRQFGETLKQKADKDSSVAKAGLAKAQADYEHAKSQYRSVTKQIQSQQNKIDEDESDRQKAVQAVLLALKNDDTAGAIQAGENHESIDGFIQAATKIKAKYDLKAQKALADMKAAKKEEKSAMDLQLAANKQYNQANSNSQVLQHQETQLESLYREQKERKAQTQAVLDRANNRVKKAEATHSQAEKLYEKRLAAGRYLRGVQMPLAKKLMSGSKESEGNAEKTETSDAAIVAKDEQNYAKAQQAVEDARKSQLAAEDKAKQSQEQLNEDTLEQQAAVQHAASAKLKLKQDVSEAEMQIANAQEEYTSAQSSPELGEEKTDSSSSPSTLKVKQPSTQQKAEQAKAVEEMEQANAAVEKAQAAYHKAFGNQAPH